MTEPSAQPRDLRQITQGMVKSLAKLLKTSGEARKKLLEDGD